MKRSLIVLGSILGVVAFLLGGLALVQAFGGRLPAWLGGAPGSAAPPRSELLFCKEHGVPEIYCTICHPELAAREPYCQEHGLLEAICTLCDPTARERLGLRTLCGEHGLPVSFCRECAAGPQGDGLQDADAWCLEHGVPLSLCVRCAPALADSVDLCPEHHEPRALCSVCRPELRRASASSLRGERNRAPGLPRVRLAGPDVVAAVGIEVAPVEMGAHRPTLEAPARIGYDEDRHAQAPARLGGSLREVRADVGDRVSAGQTLALVDAPALATLVAEHLQHRARAEILGRAYDRKRGLGTEGGVSPGELEAAELGLRLEEAEASAARERIQGLGFEAGELDALLAAPPGSRGLLPVRAPVAGTVVSRSAVGGAVVGEGAALFAVADLTRMWARIDIAVADAPRVRRGQRVVVRGAGLPASGAPGEVDWIAPELDLVTRTVSVRAVLPNPDERLRAGAFVAVSVELGEARPALFVPTAAVQWDGVSRVVFIQRDGGVFEPLRCVLGDAIEGKAEVVWGRLSPGDPVVTTGSFLLLTETQKGAIGAGCCE